MLNTYKELFCSVYGRFLKDKANLIDQNNQNLGLMWWLGPLLVLKAVVGSSECMDH